jgi:hypothetical protein
MGSNWGPTERSGGLFATYGSIGFRIHRFVTTSKQTESVCILAEDCGIVKCQEKSSGHRRQMIRILKRFIRILKRIHQEVIWILKGTDDLEVIRILQACWTHTIVESPIHGDGVCSGRPASLLQQAQQGTANLAQQAQQGT